MKTENEHSGSERETIPLPIPTLMKTTSNIKVAGCHCMALFFVGTVLTSRTDFF
jgi:hypothetical protein